MKKSHYTETQIVKMLKEVEGGRLKSMFAELSLEHRILKDIIEKSCKARAIQSGNP